jgi:hypothetical protein
MIKTLGRFVLSASRATLDASEQPPKATETALKPLAFKNVRLFKSVFIFALL